MANLHVFRDGAHDGPTNMARDEHLLYSNAFRPASLRIYGWSPPTISLGYFQSIAEVGKLPEDVRSLAVVRRTTGGGAILHDREITYCLVVDDSIPIARRAPAELYRVVHECWRKVLAADGRVSAAVAAQRAVLMFLETGTHRPDHRRRETPGQRPTPHTGTCPATRIAASGAALCESSGRKSGDRGRRGDLDRTGRPRDRESAVPGGAHGRLELGVADRRR